MNKTICDRYIWTGMAYAKVFAPKTWEFAAELYLNSGLFIQPDLYVYVRTDPDICVERRPESDLDTIKRLQDAYYDTWGLCVRNSNIISITNNGDLDITVDCVVNCIKQYI